MTMFTLIKTDLYQSSSTDGNKPKSDIKNLVSQDLESDILRAKKYFQKMLMRQNNEGLMKFPSIKSLVAYLDVSKENVYKALDELRQIGFDYKVLETNTPVIIWDSLALNTQKAG